MVKEDMPEEHEISSEAKRRIHVLETENAHMRNQMSELNTKVALLEQGQDHLKDDHSDLKDRLKDLAETVATNFRKIFYPVAVAILSMVAEMLISGRLTGFLK